MKCYRCCSWPCECKDGQTIIHGDCREVLPQLDKVDLVLTDPPYGIKRFERQSKWYDRIPRNTFATWNDNLVQDWQPILEAGNNAIVWGMNNFDLPTTEYFLVWDKQQTVPNFASAELAWTNCTLPAKVFRFAWRRVERFHPATKPIELFRWCLELAKQPKTVLDPFLGSGTTLRACKDLGRCGIGIEIEEKYCEIAAQRLRQEVLQFS